MPSVKVNSIRIKPIGQKRISEKTLNVKMVKPRDGIKTFSHPVVDRKIRYEIYKKWLQDNRTMAN